MLKWGDIEAIEEIFKNFEKILSYHEKKYFILGGNKEDIFQEASIGLIQVIISYDKIKINHLRILPFYVSKDK